MAKAGRLMLIFTRWLKPDGNREEILSIIRR